MITSSLGIVEGKSEVLDRLKYSNVVCNEEIDHYENLNTTSVKIKKVSFTFEHRKLYGNI